MIYFHTNTSHHDIFPLSQIPGFKQEPGEKPESELLVPVFLIFYQTNSFSRCFGPFNFSFLLPNQQFFQGVLTHWSFSKPTFFSNCSDPFILWTFPLKVSESLFCCWPSSISSALENLWGQHQIHDLKEDQHGDDHHGQHQSHDPKEFEPNNQDLALKETNNGATCILNVAKWWVSEEILMVFSHKKTESFTSTFYVSFCSWMAVFFWQNVKKPQFVRC